MTVIAIGKWYYEYEFMSDALYQVGWVNDKFKPDPDQGFGVGDCEHSWAADLYRYISKLFLSTPRIICCFLSS